MKIYQNSGQAAKTNKEIHLTAQTCCNSELNNILIAQTVDTK
jgi:hypothetical protein